MASNPDPDPPSVGGGTSTSETFVETIGQNGSEKSYNHVYTSCELLSNNQAAGSCMCLKMSTCPNFLMLYGLKEWLRRGINET